MDVYMQKLSNIYQNNQCTKTSVYPSDFLFTFSKHRLYLTLISFDPVKDWTILFRPISWNKVVLNVYQLYFLTANEDLSG